MSNYDKTIFTWQIHCSGHRVFGAIFWMSRKLFLKIMHEVRCYDDYFYLKKDATSKLGFTSYQKCTLAIRILAYWVFGDLVDEYIRMSDSTWLESMYRLCRGSGSSVCRSILRATKCCWHCMALGNQYHSRIFWYTGKHRLHALRMEEISIRLARTVSWPYRRVHDHSWGCCI
jgi:hypothetical protein